MLLPALLFAQSFASLNIFSENGDKFYVYLDGKKQNDIARSNIRIDQLPDLYYSAKIVFEDPSISAIVKNNLYVSDGDDVMRDASYRIRHEKGSKPRLTFYSMLPLQKNFVPTADMYVFHFGQPAVFDTLLVEKKEPVIAVTSETKPGSLNIFSQNGDKFFLFLNGVKQNTTAQSNIRISGVPGMYYNVKIVFKDNKIAPIVKNNLSVSDADDVLMDATYRIRRDKTGKPKLNFYSMLPVKDNFVAPAGMYVQQFSKPAQDVVSTPAAEPKKEVTPVKGTITNIKITEGGSSTTKTTGKSSVSTGSTKKVAENSKSNTDNATNSGKAVATAGKEEPAKTTTIPENKKCNGWPMGKGDLVAAKKAISEAEKEEEKLSAAQEIIASNCLLVSQVTEFCSLFKSEKSKLAFAKYAYKFTIDRKNYAEVNKALSLEKSKKELDKFINGG